MAERQKPPEDDLTLWQRVTREIKPYERRDLLGTDRPKQPTSAAKPEKKKRTASGRPVRLSAKQEPARSPVVGPVDVGLGEHAGLDRSTRRRLVQGQIAIEGRLDLHGMTAAQAERQLYRFIDSASLAGHRCVLVITGKGQNNQGVLRRLVPGWLKSPPLSTRILAISKAQPADGGEGALYVMLRRKRSAL